MPATTTRRRAGLPRGESSYEDVEAALGIIAIRVRVHGWTDDDRALANAWLDYFLVGTGRYTCG